MRKQTNHTETSFCPPIPHQIHLAAFSLRHRKTSLPATARRNVALSGEFSPLAASSKCAISNSERSKALANRLNETFFFRSDKAELRHRQSQQKAGFLRFFSRSCHLQRTFLPFFLFFVDFGLDNGMKRGYKDIQKRKSHCELGCIADWFLEKFLETTDCSLFLELFLRND